MQYKNYTQERRERRPILFPEMTPEMKQAWELGYYPSVVLPLVNGATYAVWTQGNDTAFPKVDLIAFGAVDLDSSTMEMFGLVPWEAVQTLLGDKMVAQHGRYYVRGAEYPSLADIERLRIEVSVPNRDVSEETCTILLRGLNVLTGQKIIRPKQFGIRTNLAGGPHELTVVEAVCWEFASEWAAQGVICISVEVFRGAHVFEPANVQQLTSDLRDQDQVIYEWANELVATLMGHFARQRDTPRQPS